MDDGAGRRRESVPRTGSKANALRRSASNRSAVTTQKGLCIVEGVPHRVRLLRADSVDLLKISRETQVVIRD
jgi:hypothetical protein